MPNKTMNTMTTTKIKIQNLKCHGCANTIITQLSKLNGISEVQVNHNPDEVHFNFTDESDLEIVTKKLSDLGYPAEGESNTLPKKAKSFVSCAVGRLSEQKD
jgi:copper chaperone